MLVSNQRPLPCESEACSFAIVRRYPISVFLGLITQCLRRGRSLSSAPVVVKLSSDHRLPKLLILSYPFPSYLYAPARGKGVLGSSSPCYRRYPTPEGAPGYASGTLSRTRRIASTTSCGRSCWMKCPLFSTTL